MKATIEIPDELYRKVEAKSALLGKPVREVTVELFERWLAEERAPGGREAPEAWLAALLARADEAIGSAQPGPPAREELEAGRNRLDRR
ncbi:MAG: hypothetical protein N2544_00960 [Burkholderiales bacterium]|nr:hypothetical protein [Burkholderiales bacterium]